VGQSLGRWVAMWCARVISSPADRYRPKENDWAGAGNVDILSFETPGGLTEATKKWNMQARAASGGGWGSGEDGRHGCAGVRGRPRAQTQSWLARYCNQRLPQGINVFATYLLSAFWHGEGEPPAGRLLSSRTHSPFRTAAQASTPATT
jgi:hypothetical protein